MRLVIFAWMADAICLQLKEAPVERKTQLSRDMAAVLVELASHNSALDDLVAQMHAAAYEVESSSSSSSEDDCKTAKPKMTKRMEKMTDKEGLPMVSSFIRDVHDVRSHSIPLNEHILEKQCLRV